MKDNLIGHLSWKIIWIHRISVLILLYLILSFLSRVISIPFQDFLLLIIFLTLIYNKKIDSTLIFNAWSYMIIMGISVLVTIFADYSSFLSNEVFTEDELGLIFLLAITSIIIVLKFVKEEKRTKEI